MSDKFPAGGFVPDDLGPMPEPPCCVIPASAMEGARFDFGDGTIRAVTVVVRLLPFWVVPDGDETVRLPSLQLLEDV